MAVMEGKHRGARSTFFGRKAKPVTEEIEQKLPAEDRYLVTVVSRRDATVKHVFKIMVLDGELYKIQSKIEASLKELIPRYKPADWVLEDMQRVFKPLPPGVVAV